MSGTYSKTIFDIQTSSETFFEKCEKSGFLALKNAHILQDKVEISTWTGFLIQIILEICLEMFYFLSPSIPCNKRPSLSKPTTFFVLNWQNCCFLQNTIMTWMGSDSTFHYVIPLCLVANQKDENLSFLWIYGLLGRSWRPENLIALKVKNHTHESPWSKLGDLL